jgi:hypothetical protein
MNVKDALFLSRISRRGKGKEKVMGGEGTPSILHICGYTHIYKKIE